MKKMILLFVVGSVVAGCGSEKPKTSENEKKQVEVSHEDRSVQVVGDHSTTVIENIDTSIGKDSEGLVQNEPIVNEKNEISRIVDEINSKKKEEVIVKKETISEPDVKVESMVEGEGNNEPKHSVLPQKMVITFNHNKFNELLQKHVSSDGRVNYKSFKKEEVKLNSYLAMLKDSEPKESWSRNKQLAYWINLYNASTVSLILQNYPLKSIMDIPKAWDKLFVKVGAKTYSLNQIENEIIRPTFKEPRIHFAVNCAAISCPKLANEAFSEKNLNSLLAANTAKFLNNSEIGMIKEGKKVQLSQIFEWYSVDFGGKENLLAWISKNSTHDLSKSKFKGFIPYQWQLNE